MKLMSNCLVLFSLCVTRSTEITKNENRIRNHSIGNYQNFNAKNFCEAKQINVHAVECKCESQCGLELLTNLSDNE